MQLLLEVQSKVLDKIEDSVDQAYEYTEEAAIDMKKATVYQKKAWKKKLIFCGIAAAILVILVIILIGYSQQILGLFSNK